MQSTMMQRSRMGVASKACPVAAPQRLISRAPRRSVAPKAAAVSAASAVSVEQINRCVNAIRFLAIDAVNKAKSGHPGLPMGCAPMSYVLFNEAMKYNPKDPKWFNRWVALGEGSKGSSKKHSCVGAVCVALWARCSCSGPSQMRVLMLMYHFPCSATQGSLRAERWPRLHAPVRPHAPVRLRQRVGESQLAEFRALKGLGDSHWRWLASY